MSLDALYDASPEELAFLHPLLVRVDILSDFENTWSLYIHMYAG